MSEITPGSGDSSDSAAGSPGEQQRSAGDLPRAYPLPGYQNASHQQGPPAPPPQQPTYIVMPPRGRGWTITLGIMLLFSVLFNFIVIIVLAAGAASDSSWKASASVEKLRKGKGDKEICVLPVYDVLGPETADWISKGLKELADDDSVGAIVLHVDTPGGSVPASDQIYHAIMQFREKSHKKVIIAQGGFATSGGYYISAAADYIVAEPTTWTGNIGVIMITFNAQEGLENKLGVKPVVITSSDTPFKDVPSMFREMKPEERAYVQGLVQSAYDRFVEIVYEGRKDAKVAGGKSFTHLHAGQLANGKIYTADEALSNGLIDQKGYLADAIDAAITQAGLDKPPVRFYSPRPATLGEILMGNAPAGPPSASAAEIIGDLSAPRLMYIYQGQIPLAGYRKLDYRGN